LKAVLNLRQQGFECYCPMIREKMERRGEVAFIERALFPRYLFIKIQDVWKSVTSTFGVSSMIMADEAPALLDDFVIESLKCREDVSGFVVLPDKEDTFKRGLRARVESGLFAGRNALVEGMTSETRVVVLMRLLGRETRVELAADDLAIA